MRSRTELVTTTFVDSEEDYSEDDDSEEDWRPSASNKNGRKQKQQRGASAAAGKRGRKRKGSSNPVTINKSSAKRKTTYEESDDEEEDEEPPSDEEFNSFDDEEEAAGPSHKKPPTNLPPKKQFSDKNSTTTTTSATSATAMGGGGSSNSNNSATTDNILSLLIYARDLVGDYTKNQRLCLWRKDDSNLLQKYIRVKTTSEEFLFTSSSVYSSWDDKRVSDFLDIQVKSMDVNNRRVKIIDVSELGKLSKQATDLLARRKEKGEKPGSDYEEFNSEDLSDVEVSKTKKSSDKIAKDSKENNRQMITKMSHKPLEQPKLEEAQERLKRSASDTDSTYISVRNDNIG
uniref:Uncharacterized protein n=1 Tax=Glossina brevipalpis TaxID=37001 RepID=A0A1A9WEP6_9MUSC